MYSYIKGIVKMHDSNSVVVENNGIGYLLVVANPYQYKIDEEILIYVHQHVREDSLTLFGFNEIEEKKLFLKLLSVTGIGPKSALSIIAGDYRLTINAIENGDSHYMKNFPGIGAKASQQIILDLKGKLDFSAIPTRNEEMIEVLIALGYSRKEIEKVSKNIDQNLDTSTQVKEALKLMVK